MIGILAHFSGAKHTKTARGELTRFLSQLLIGILALCVATALIGFALPRRISVSSEQDLPRSAAIARIVLEDLTRFDAWSPWRAQDPAMATQATSGETPLPGRGLGSVYTYASDPMGRGSFTIVQSDASRSQWRVDLEDGRALTFDFTLTALNEGQSRINWTIAAAFPPGALSGWAALLSQQRLRRDMAAGLNAFEALLEAIPVDASTGPPPVFIEEQGAAWIYIDREALARPSQIHSATVVARSILLERAGRLGLVRTGPFARLWVEPEADQRVRFRVALPVSAPIADSETGILGLTTPAGLVMRADFDDVTDQSLAMQRLRALARLYNVTPTEPLVELLLEEPTPGSAPARVRRFALSLQP